MATPSSVVLTAQGSHKSGTLAVGSQATEKYWPRK